MLRGCDNRGWKIFGIVAVTILVLGAMFCLAVCIGSAVNGLTFGEEVSMWFGSSSPVEEVVDEIVETTSRIIG